MRFVPAALLALVLLVGCRPAAATPLPTPIVPPPGETVPCFLNGAWIRCDMYGAPIQP